jgi:hypothetical protein
MRLARTRFPLIGVIATLILSESGLAQTPADTVFVKVANDSPKFSLLTGIVVRVERDYLVFRDAGGIVTLYKRPDVAYVGLAKDEGQLTRHGDSTTVANYWNQEGDAVTMLVGAIPVFGQSVVRALERSPRFLRVTISLLLLIGALVWLGFRGYDLILVSREQAQLSRVKLTMDIVKTRSEALLLLSHSPEEAAQLNAIEVPLLSLSTPRAVQPNDLKSIKPSYPSIGPARSLRSRSMYRLGRIFMSDADRGEFFDLALAALEVRGRRGSSNARRWYWRRRLTLLFQAGAAWFYGAFGIFAPVMVIVALVEQDPTMYPVAVLYVLLLGLIPFAWRYSVKARTLKLAYAAYAVPTSPEPAPARAT